MKKVFCALLAALTLLAAAVVPAYAVDSSKSYLFELSIDGGDTKHAAAGDIVTVLLTLKRTDQGRGLHHVRHAGRNLLRSRVLRAGAQ